MLRSLHSKAIFIAIKNDCLTSIKSFGQLFASRLGKLHRKIYGSPPLFAVHSHELRPTPALMENEKAKKRSQ
jgi:hypothetical protein